MSRKKKKSSFPGDEKRIKTIKSSMQTKQDLPPGRLEDNEADAIGRLRSKRGQVK